MLDQIDLELLNLRLSLLFTGIEGIQHEIMLKIKMKR